MWSVVASSLQSMMEEDTCAQENMLPYILLRVYLAGLLHNCCIWCGILIVSTSFDNLHQKWATRLFKYHDVPKKIYYMKTQLPNPVQNYEICRKFNHFGNLLSPIW